MISIKLTRTVATAMLSLLVLTQGIRQAAAGPLRVYILAGQSNMQGHANISTIDYMANDPKTAPILKEMKAPDGSLVTCDRVWIASIGCGGNQYSDLIENKGKLTAGFGASASEIGPEYTFGLYMQKTTRDPILIIKTSWGGRNLHTDFRPPSAGTEQIGDYTIEQWKRRKLNVEEETAKIQQNGGVFYREMIKYIKKVLDDIPRVVPNYNPKQGYKLSGFVWFQGFNDLVDSWTYHDTQQPGAYAEYGRLMGLLIKDVRKDLSAPKLPVVIGVMGIGGEKEGQRPQQHSFRLAQAAPTTLPEFKGTVRAVQTSQLWADDLDELQNRMQKFNGELDKAYKQSPNLTREERDALRASRLKEAFTPEELQKMKGISNGGYHYLGAASILAPIGKAFAETLADMQKHGR